MYNRFNNTIFIPFLVSVLCVLLLVGFAKSKDLQAQQKVDWVTIYESSVLDSFTFQNKIFGASFGQLPDSLQPKFDITFCNQYLGIPKYFPSNPTLNISVDTAFSIITDSSEISTRKVRKDYNYYPNGCINSYVVFDKGNYEEYTYQYTDTKQITAIHEKYSSIEIVYNKDASVHELHMLDGKKRFVKKYVFAYSTITIGKNI